MAPEIELKVTIEWLLCLLKPKFPPRFSACTAGGARTYVYATYTYVDTVTFKCRRGGWRYERTFEYEMDGAWLYLPPSGTHFDTDSAEDTHKTLDMTCHLLYSKLWQVSYVICFSSMGILAPT